MSDHNGIITTDGWKHYWGLSRTPFGKRLAPSELFDHPGHQEAVARIRWAIAENAIACVTGEVGAGKTVAARAAVESLDRAAHTIIYVGNAGVGARGIHQHIAYALGVAPRFHRGALINQTYELLARERDERHKRSVLVCDEAHLLDADQLEQLRMLTNDALDSDSLVAVVLIGQPTLRRVLRRGSFAALDQRIAVRYHLTSLDAEHTAGYLAHHLTLAGRHDALFADDAVAAIAHAARGLPRQIGNLATAALIAAAARRNRLVDHDAALAAIADANVE
jgi:type II secretory pathway predicted ATPase ExeA